MMSAAEDGRIARALNADPGERASNCRRCVKTDELLCAKTQAGPIKDSQHLNGYWARIKGVEKE